MNRTEIIRKISEFVSSGISFVFAVNFNGDDGFVLTPEEASDRGILYNICGITNAPFRPPLPVERFTPSPVSFEHYCKAFHRIMFHLMRGDTYLLNLTFPTELDTSLTLEDIFNTSKASYKLLVPGKFVVFSPEIFVRISNGIIRSFPMKGTIDADVVEAEKIILADEKEFFEHNTIVDLIRNDLAMVSTDVRVARFRYIERIHTNRRDLLQVSSEITGQLPADWQNSAGEILFKLLPAGSVTGAPKECTVKIINKVEGYDRGFYTGIFGYFNGEKIESAVIIRFIEQRGPDLIFKSGGGITARSNVESEYNEMIQKVYVPIV